MHDRRKSTLPPPRDPEDTSGFREDLLMLFRPEDATALRHVGKMLHTLILEAGPNFGSEGESLTLREMHAGLADLIHTRDFF